MADPVDSGDATLNTDHSSQTARAPHPTHIDLESQTSPFTHLEEIPENSHVQIVESSKRSHENSAAVTPVNRSATGVSRASVKSLRRRGRSNTSKYAPEQLGVKGCGWQPGLEPGIDTLNPAAPYEHSTHLDELHTEDLNTHCEITVVDFSRDKMDMFELDNNELAGFLQRPKDVWVSCRWINVNGLSWDVIRILGNHKGLHRLAVEDLMNTQNRSKVDWYNGHTFVILALQKLEDISDLENSSSDADSEDEKPHWRKMKRRGKDDERKLKKKSQKKRRNSVIWDFWNDISGNQKKTKKKRTPNPNELNSAKGLSIANPDVPTHTARTLQRYHAGANQDRVDYMERNAILKPKNYKVIMEQVSIFLTNDNTVISFFEDSAKAIEDPITRRLKSPETILRQSCDASMVLQAIIDAIIDLALEVSGAYQDALGGLELDVLTDPDISQAKRLYILTSEIAVLRNAVQPITTVVTSLKDRKADAPAATPGGILSSSNNNNNNNNSSSSNGFPTKQFGSGVTITPLTHTYLGDVEDHCILITDSYDQMHRSADNLVDLIFNTIGAYQNESMRQLTLVTCLFLPLTFLCGYFGMNFGDFPVLAKNKGEAYFWQIALPSVVATMVFLMRDKIWRWTVRQADRGLILRGRKRRGED